MKSWLVFQPGLLTVEMVLDFLHKLPDTLEVILTGRNPDVRLLEQARLTF